jgi:ribosomal protein S18 acetylase RimI-like enzyme
MVDSLVEFFKDIREAGSYNQYYHPFELTAEVAREQCSHKGSDLIFVIAVGKKIIGHGMLRGWEEGYRVPSLGIIIHPDFAGMGIGAMFMRFLHLAAWFKDAKAIRLSVYKDNIPAVNMYKKLGYELVHKNSKVYIGTLRRSVRE